MFTTTRFVILITAGAALAAGAATGAWIMAPAQPPILQTATALHPPRPLPPFALVDGHGQPFTHADLEGAWHLLFFGFTHCPDVCPTTLARLAAVREALAGSGTDPRVVFISVDPRRDQPQELRAYLAHFGPGFVGVTGPVEELHKLADALYLPFSTHGKPGDKDYRVDHSATVVLVGPHAKARAYFSAPHEVARIAADLRQLLGA